MSKKKPKKKPISLANIQGTLDGYLDVICEAIMEDEEPDVNAFLEEFEDTEDDDLDLAYYLGYVACAAEIQTKSPAKIVKTYLEEEYVGEDDDQEEDDE